VLATSYVYLVDRAKVSDADYEVIVAYLARNYGAAN